MVEVAGGIRATFTWYLDGRDGALLVFRTRERRLKLACDFCEVTQEMSEVTGPFWKRLQDPQASPIAF